MKQLVFHVARRHARGARADRFECPVARALTERFERTVTVGHGSVQDARTGYRLIDMTKRLIADIAASDRGGPPPSGNYRVRLTPVGSDILKARRAA